MARSATVACDKTPSHSGGPGNIKVRVRVSFKMGLYGGHPSNSWASCFIFSAINGLNLQHVNAITKSNFIKKVALYMPMKIILQIAS